MNRYFVILGSYKLYVLRLVLFLIYFDVAVLLVKMSSCVVSLSLAAEKARILWHLKRVTKLVVGYE